jgi:YjbE family integral membrane protein
MTELFTAELFTTESLAALLQVIMIDLVLAGDNAIIIGLAAAGLPAEDRKKVIVIGIAAATVMRIGFALATTQLLQIVGLLLVGGLLLFYVSWKMWVELRSSHAVASTGDGDFVVNADGTISGIPPRKTFVQAVMQVVIADVSMSLDNVLAVAGAAREHPLILIVGLALAIAMMGFAATFIARLLQRHRWIAYIGLAVIVYVSIDMTYRGFAEVLPYLRAGL